MVGVVSTLWFWCWFLSETLRLAPAAAGEASGACLCCLFQILVIIGLTHALVVFRVIAAVLLAEGSWEFLSNHSNTGAMMLGAILHYLIITVMTRVGRQLLGRLLAASSVTLISSLSLQINRIVAMKLCEIGTNHFKSAGLLVLE